MASQRFSNFPPSPNKKTRVKKSKRQPEDDADHARPKKSKRSKDVLGSQPDGVAEDHTGEEHRRTKRSGAGSGGRVSQMEKIGTTLEMPVSRPRKVAGMAEDLPDNPLAPPRKEKRRKAQSSNPPPPYPSVALEPVGIVNRENVGGHDQINPHFYQAQNKGRFGFSADLPPIVPPGTEPDMHINNPHVTAARMQATAITGPLASTTPRQQWGSPSDSDRFRESGLPSIPNKQFGPRSDVPIDPVLLLQSTRPPSSTFPAKSYPGAMARHEDSASESESKDGSDLEEMDSDDGHGGDEDDEMPDVGWAATGQARKTHPGFSLETEPLAPTRHYRDSVPEPDHEFQHSRDEDDEVAQSVLRGNDGTATDEFAGEDVLEQHYVNNGRPSAPAPEQLALLAHRSQAEMAPKVRAPRNSKKPKDASPCADNMGFYPATWKDCLEDAKRECRAAHALHNPFPSRARDLDISVTESLVTVVVEWTKRGTAFQPGYWPEHKRDMAAVLLGDMSTWRSELKKITIAHTPAAYYLTPPGTVLQERTRWVEDAASNLLERSMFLRNGLDENGKTNNFAHPSLKYALIEFFYTGNYRVADKRANLFRTSVPLPCLALVGAAYNCALDGFAKNGSGKSFPNFSGKSYNSVFRAMLGMLQDIEKDSYHGAKLQAQLAEWGRDGWNALQGIDATIGRHNHLQIALD